MLIGLFLIILGLGFIGFGVYIKVKDVSFRKKAIPTKFLVKKVEEIIDNDVDEGKIVRGYKTTFEFEYNGIKKEEDMIIDKKLKEGSIKNGMYLYENGKSTISVAGEGFYLAKGGEYVLFAFGIITLTIGAFCIFEFSGYILLLMVFVFFAFIFLFIMFSNSAGTKSKNKKEQIYYSDANDNDYSTVNSSLCRYIPKPQEYKKGFNPTIILVLFLICMGLAGCVLGVKSTAEDIEKRMTYGNVEGKVIDIREKNVKSTEGDDEIDLYVTYTYNVDGVDYNLEYYGGQKNSFNKYEIGDTTKIYYDKNNPGEAVTKSDLNSFVPLGVGILFVFIGIFIFVEDRKRKKIYMAYVSLEENKK